MISSVLLAVSVLASSVAVDPTGRYIQCRDGEIQLLPALSKEEIPGGAVTNVAAVGGFFFDIAWRENKMTQMTVRSTEGGSCRIRSSAGIYSPLLRKTKHESANPAIRATKDRPEPSDAPPSIFLNPKRYPSVAFDFDTSKGETLVFRGVSGNQDWTGRAARFTDDFLKTDEAARIASNVLAYQLETGGWPKNVPMDHPLTERERSLIVAAKGDRIKGTIDNGATRTEMRFLARMYKATGEAAYREGVVRGIEFLLYMQYPNGGWPQCDPAKGGYWSQITFNDGAMIGTMETLRQVAEARPPYDFELPDELKSRCRAAFDRGLKCILKTQIVQDGKRTVWCQQYDRETLSPCQGRAFELTALCTAESVGIVELLMSLPRTPEIDAAIEGACDWWRRVAVRGYAVERNWRRPDGVLGNRLVQVDPETNPPLWARYYTIEDNRPFTGTREGTRKFTFEEMLEGDNMSYQWWNGSGEKIAKAYENWKHAAEKRRAAADRLAAGVRKHAKGGVKRMLSSEMARNPDPTKIDAAKRPKWNYSQGLLLEAMLRCADEWGEFRKSVVPYVKAYLDTMVRPDGTIVAYDAKDCKLDCVKPGMMVFAAEQYLPKEKSRLDRATDEMARQLVKLQPRTKEGGFWHKKIYPHQIWLDGLYMAEPFYVRYAMERCEGKGRREMLHDAVNQFRVAGRHCYDPKTGLFRHGWDEAKSQAWADRENGQSAHAWGRAQGWFIAAIVDTLELLPDAPAESQLAADREWLLKLYRGYCQSLTRHQSSRGAWYQVADAPLKSGNYEEATATALIAYAMLKGWNNGWAGVEVRDAGVKALDCLMREFVKENSDGTVSLTRCCAVAGLGSDRPGTFEYYLSEPIRDNDAKGVGPYLMALVEAGKMKDAAETMPVIAQDFSDPDVCEGADGRIYLTASSFGGVPGLPILVSDDMVNWQYVGYALERLPYPESVGSPEHGNAVWAPSIRYRADRGEYVIWWGDPDRGAYRVAAKSPAGPWSEPRLVVPAKGLIDVCPLYDDDGRVYLVNGWARSRAGFNSVLTVRELDADETRQIGEPVMVYDGVKEGNFTCEGPKFYKKDGEYWLWFPAGGVAGGWQVAARAKSVWGPYEARTVLAQGTSDVNGPHQGGVVKKGIGNREQGIGNREQGIGEEWAFIHFSDREAWGRLVFLQPVKWPKGDWPIVGDNGTPVSQPSTSTSTSTSTYSLLPIPYSLLPITSEFDGVKLGPQWQFLGRSADFAGWCTPDGYYRLYTTPKQGVSLWDVPNIMVQKFTYPGFTATFKVRVGATGGETEAGLIVMGRSYARLFLRYRAEQKDYEIVYAECLGADRGAKESPAVVLGTMVPRMFGSGDRSAQVADIQLRLTVKAVPASRGTIPSPECSFAWSTDGADWHEVPQTFIATPGKWIGATFGVFAISKSDGTDRGWLDLDYVR